MRWSSLQWETSLCWSCPLYDSRSTFRSQCSEAISAYARLVKFNPSILRVQNWLAPVVCERRAYHTRASHGVSARRTVATVHTQGEHLYLEILVRDHLLCYRRSKQIRCKNMINITCNQIVTWYGQYHFAPLISIFAAPWSSSSPAWHHDLHHHDLHHRVFMKLSRQLLLLLLWLTL